MTRDEIENMQAGQDMDLLVSDKVLRFTSKDWNARFFSSNGNRTQFSTDISDAWIVLLKFPEVYIEYKNEEYFVMIGDDFDASVTDKSAPLAICKAALLAVIDIKRDEPLTLTDLPRPWSTDEMKPLPYEVYKDFEQGQPFKDER